MNLKILKTYIKNNLVNGFFKPSKSFAGTFIFFNKKLNKSLQLCLDYQGLNNLIIKNCYPLFLIRELLDQISWAWRFT